ncbi:uncharacterized protein [Oscarella lobularis]|uniref:uncharacterized protein isoform X2 n=1 Tax=Oscarella lobularis TaxID=121494 RepID=UPI0033132037
MEEQRVCLSPLEGALYGGEVASVTFLRIASQLPRGEYEISFVGRKRHSRTKAERVDFRTFRFVTPNHGVPESTKARVLCDNSSNKLLHFEFLFVDRFAKACDYLPGERTPLALPIVIALGLRKEVLDKTRMDELFVKYCRGSVKKGHRNVATILRNVYPFAGRTLADFAADMGLNDFIARLCRLPLQNTSGGVPRRVPKKIPDSIVATIDGHSLQFQNRLTLSTSIGAEGAIISSPEMHSFTEIPPGAVRGSGRASMGYYKLEKSCSRSLVAIADRVFLDTVHLSLTGVALDKPASLFIRHHMALPSNEYSEVRVYCCSDAAAGRPWSRIATLHRVGSCVVKNDMQIKLEKDFVVIKTSHFCEFCISVQGCVQFVAQLFTPISPPSDCFQVTVVLTCCCEQTVKWAEQNKDEGFLKNEEITLCVSTKSKKDVTVFSCDDSSLGWSCSNDTDVVFTNQDMKELLRKHRALSQRRSMFFSKNHGTDGDISTLRLQLSFRKGDEEIGEITVGTRTASGKPFKFPRGVTLTDVFSTVCRHGSHKFLAIGRCLFHCQTSQVLDIASLVSGYHRSEQLRVILEEWEKSLESEQQRKSYYAFATIPMLQLVA